MDTGSNLILNQNDYGRWSMIISKMNKCPILTEIKTETWAIHGQTATLQLITGGYRKGRKEASGA